MLYRVDLVYTPEQCGWLNDGPTPANKVFPHNGGKWALVEYREIARLSESEQQLRAENERLQEALETIAADAKTIKDLTHKIRDTERERERLRGDLRLIEQCAVSPHFSPAGFTWEVWAKGNRIAHKRSLREALDAAREEE